MIVSGACLLQLYQNSFQGNFLRQSQQFYSDEAESLWKQLDLAEYLKHVKKRLSEEENRLVAYLNAQVTRPALMATLDSELIAKQLPHLVFSCISLIRDKSLDDLRLFYALLRLVDF